MSCIKCQSDRIMSITGKCSDTCGGDINNVEFEGYVPRDLGIGGGDYIEFSYCLDCGQIQGKFPMPKCDLEEVITENYFKEFYENYFTPNTLINNINKNHISTVLKSEPTVLKQFISKILCYNSGSRLPSVDELWNMYQNNHCYIDVE